MFTTASSMTISKPNPFDVYPHIATQYTNIKGLSSFTNYLLFVTLSKSLVLFY